MAQQMDIDEKVFTDPESGRNWRLRILRPGTAYGTTNSLIWQSKLINAPDAIGVEFWDYDVNRNKAKFPNGQFVTRYYVDTLLKDRELTHPTSMRSAGLNLYGGEPAWNVSGKLLEEAFAWIKSLCPELEAQQESGDADQDVPGMTA